MTGGNPQCVLVRLRKCDLCKRDRRKDQLFRMKTLDAVVCRKRISCSRHVAENEMTVKMTHHCTSVMCNCRSGADLVAVAR